VPFSALVTGAVATAGTTAEETGWLVGKYGDPLTRFVLTAGRSKPACACAGIVTFGLQIVRAGGGAATAGDSGRARYWLHPATRAKPHRHMANRCPRLGRLMFDLPLSFGPVRAGGGATAGNAGPSSRKGQPKRGQRPVRKIGPRWIRLEDFATNDGCEAFAGSIGCDGEKPAAPLPLARWGKEKRSRMAREGSTLPPPRGLRSLAKTVLHREGQRAPDVRS
jgi:hypothetical protein